MRNIVVEMVSAARMIACTGTCIAQSYPARSIRMIVPYVPGGGSIVGRQDAKGRVNDYPFWLGEPIDIADSALFLASNEPRMIRVP